MFYCCRIIGRKQLLLWSWATFLMFVVGCGSFRIVEVKEDKGDKGKSEKIESKSNASGKKRKNVNSGVAQRPKDSIESSVLTINSNHITADEVIDRIMPDLVLAGQKYNRKMYYVKARELALRAIYDMIYENLLYEEVSGMISEEQNPAVEKAIDQAVENMIKKRAGGSRVRFEKQLSERGLDMTVLRNQLRKQILTQQYLREKFRSKIIVTRDDLWEYYKSHRKEFYTPGRAHVLMIELKIDKFLPKGVKWSQASKEQKQIAEVIAERRATMILKRLRAGENFSELAKQFSTSPSGKLGGDIGWITRGSYKYKKIEDCVFNLKPGEIGGPIRIGRKIYILKLAELKQAKRVAFIDAQEKIRNKLEQKLYAELVNGHIQKLWKKSRISPIQPFLKTVMSRLPSYYSMKSKTSNELP